MYVIGFSIHLDFILQNSRNTTLKKLLINLCLGKFSLARKWKISSVECLQAKAALHAQVWRWLYANVGGMSS